MSIKGKIILGIWSGVGLMGLGAVIGGYGLGIICVVAIVGSAVVAVAD